MILSDLTGYLARHRQVSLMDLAYRFESNPDALRGMLSILERKGRVRRVSTPAGCGTACSTCDAATIETYEWIGIADARQPTD
ncbi:MAG: FeoC-like transcriptional regulator [Thiocapsa sp.]|jgi:predicted transcriptional regulator of viral defense system|nr:FeoC-like transcriptional regulator [Thiocapsa sp.]MCG6897898.1 FeoC-like transcriptional regulator [Thiocapsa sp.]MCG6984317.1 FeoC-like transcriptional regulator [Thiocapsa sp.]